jgi:hypothetical protein
MQWYYGLGAGLLVQGRWEMVNMPAASAVLLHQSALDIWTDSNVVSTELRKNCGSAYKFCSTATLQCYGCMD